MLLYIILYYIILYIVLLLYTHADLAQIYSVGLQEIFVSRLCSQGENYFFLPCRQASFCCDFRCDFLLLVDVNEWRNYECWDEGYKYSQHSLLIYSFTSIRRRKSQRVNMPLYGRLRDLSLFMTAGVDTQPFTHSKFCLPNARVPFSLRCHPRHK